MTKGPRRNLSNPPMIRVSGSARRAFTFPAELPVAYAYYADVGRVLSYLPRICLVRAYGPDQFRLVYRSTELGVYQVRIFADVQTRLEEGWVLRVAPLSSVPPLKGRADARTTRTQGYFSSRSVFYDEGEQTRIEYTLKLWGELPTPRGLRFMPGVMVDRVAATITGMRMDEIVAGFVERSVDAFPDWLAEMQNHSAWPDLSQVRVLAVPVPDCPEEHP
jgi:hypothetical protein